MSDRPMFNDKAPRRIVLIVAVLGLVLMLDLLYAANHRREPSPKAVQIGCALVVTRDGTVCS